MNPSLLQASLTPVGYCRLSHTRYLQSTTSWDIVGKSDIVRIAKTRVESVLEGS